MAFECGFKLKRKENDYIDLFYLGNPGNAVDSFIKEYCLPETNMYEKEELILDCNKLEAACLRLKELLLIINNTNERQIDLIIDAEESGDYKNCDKKLRNKLLDCLYDLGTNEVSRVHGFMRLYSFLNFLLNSELLQETIIYYRSW